MKIIKLFEEFKNELNIDPIDIDPIDISEDDESIEETKLEGLIARANAMIGDSEYTIETPDEAIQALNDFLDMSDDGDEEPIINLIEEIEEFIEVKYTTESMNESKDGKIVFEMTGSPKDDMQMLPAKERTKAVFAEALGKHGYVHGRLNKDCDLLVTNSPESASLKMQKADDYDCKVVTYASLIRKYKLFKK